MGCTKPKKPEIKEKEIEILNEKSITEIQKIQNCLLDLHNLERSSKNIGNLILDKNLCEYAQNHTENMFLRNKLRHSNIKNVGANFVAENIAYGQETCEEVTKSWMNSYFHKMNILNKKYKKVGFGYINKNGIIYWCAVFTN